MRAHLDCTTQVGLALPRRPIFPLVTSVTNEFRACLHNLPEFPNTPQFMPEKKRIGGVSKLRLSPDFSSNSGGICLQA
jgi:hypothetical protein